MATWTVSVSTQRPQGFRAQLFHENVAVARVSWGTENWRRSACHISTQLFRSWEKWKCYSTFIIFCKKTSVWLHSTNQQITRLHGKKHLALVPTETGLWSAPTLVCLTHFLRESWQNSRQMGWSRIRPCLCLLWPLIVSNNQLKILQRTQIRMPRQSIFRRFTNPLGCQKRKNLPKSATQKNAAARFCQCHDWEQSYHYDNSKKDSCIDPAVVHIDLIPTNEHRHLGLLCHWPILDGIFTKLVHDVQVHSSQYTSANVRHLGLIRPT